MRPRIALMAGIVAVAGLALWALPHAVGQQDTDAGHDAGQPTAMAAPMSCEGMAQMREQMMARMKAGDEKLAALAAEMNRAGDQAATVAAMKDLLNEMVAQRHAMPQMAGMHQKMMAHMMGHAMQCMEDKGGAGGMKSMQDCPMMKGMGGMMGQGGDAPQATASAEHRAITTDTLEPYECGTITRLHTLGGVFLASQPKPEDFAQAKKGGVKTVINLRHADEIKDFDEKKVVESEGLKYINLPWDGPAELTDEVFDQARAHLKTAERPILLHCASANRVGAVWLPYRVLDGGLSWDDALAEAKTVGLKSPDYEAKAKDYIQRHTK